MLSLKECQEFAISRGGKCLSMKTMTQTSFLKRGR